MLSSYANLYTMSSIPSDTRTRILASALKLLEGKRGAMVRMSDIAKQAGVSRQALYLHFKSRTELLVAATRYIDEVKNIDERLLLSRTTNSGIERLEAFIEAWGNYIPEIYGMGRALMAAKDTDDAAAQAWDGRMDAVRQGCKAAVYALQQDNELAATFSTKQATDILWTLLSVRNWEQFTVECGWSQKKYIETITALAKRSLVADH